MQASTHPCALLCWELLRYFAATEQLRAPAVAALPAAGEVAPPKASTQPCKLPLGAHVRQEEEHCSLHQQATMHGQWSTLIARAHILQRLLVSPAWSV
jgi:hypothetical protein